MGNLLHLTQVSVYGCRARSGDWRSSYTAALGVLMLAWMIYVVIVTLVLTLAALCAEHALRLQQQMTRWVWIGTIVASLIVPATIASVSIQVPSMSGPDPGPPVPLRNLTSVPLPGLHELLSLPHVSAADAPAVNPAVPAKHLSITVDAALEGLWLAASGAFLCMLLVSGVKLAVRERRWRRAQVSGVPVYMAEGVGPAVVGLIWPRIVLPPWVLEEHAERQALVLAHEVAHLEARDPLVLTIAISLLVFMPWNLPLWWQLRQLRRAIEVDCDARVLRAGHDVGSYGEALIYAGERQSGSLGAVAAMAENRSFMEERIRIMIRVPGRWWQMSAAALAGLSVSLLALAVQVRPPPDTAVAEVTAGEQPASYDGYVGVYQFAALVAHVRRQGTHLYFKASARSVPEVEIFPLRGTEFFGKDGVSNYRFRTDARGRAVALITRKNDMVATWLKVDESRVPAVDGALRARLQSQTPAAGSEAAVREYWQGLLAGKPRYDNVETELAHALREQAAHQLALAQQAGALQSVRFRGVGYRGQDVYDLIGQHDTVTFDITLTPAGQIGLLVLSLGPTQSRAPQPGGEAAIVKHWASLIAGEPNYGDLGPLLAVAAHQQRPQLLELARQRGALKGLSFRGVDRNGLDVYDANYASGDVMTWHVQMGPEGKLESCLIALGPSS